ncbi:hypothetical protein B1R32_11484 [Abditibacterium utsteinense]|uniref:Uncharacterized protein n=2 Tax=Abditibacterium utsteinense TaxID=1960156 RepID=A0A2S8SR55_9BACT|nr:hypothetical protein B1R32_11484 [Abditibacterium utsteinense]
MRDEKWMLPNRVTVLSHLENLIEEKSSRQEIADWASQFIRGDYDHVHVKDWPAWEMLSTLAGADIQDSPTQYLYGKEDFEDWAAHLKSAPLVE